MKIRFSFTVEVPDHATAGLVRAAGRSAVCAVENTIENVLESGPKPHAAVGGTVRVTIKANDGE